MGDSAFDRRIAAVRRFNRLYTQRIGILQESYLKSEWSLAEVRVLYELAHRHQSTAAELSKGLGFDPGYLSRVLRRFERRGFVSKQRSPYDGREMLLELTAEGRAAFAPLNDRSREEIGELLGLLDESDQRQMVSAMETIERLLGGAPHAPVSYLLRPPHPGDYGWVVQLHGALYAEEYGWNEQFEALVAEIVAHFIRNFDIRRERCWIAEKDGENAGSVFLVRHPEREEVARLRMLIVDPSARGLGIGRRLVDECTRFARHAGYTSITLWTNSLLVGARRIYESAGYELVASEPIHEFGHDLISETWELKF